MIPDGACSLPDGNKKARRSGLSEGRKVLLDHLDVARLRAFLAHRGVVGHLVVLLEGLETRTLDSGEVGEQILAAVIRRDESEALCIVEPLDLACTHVFTLERN